ncbi:MAG: NifU family protein [Acidimicrobiia bacterium]
MTSTETETGTPPTAAPEGSLAEYVLTVTPRAIEKVLELRAGEDDADLMGLRVEITGHSGVDFTYDLAFEPLEDVADGDSVTVQDGLPVIVPAGTILNLQGATLDLPTNAAQGGLVIRNPNRPNPLAGVDLELSGSMAEKVQQLLEQSINPSLAAHGGFATLFGVDEAAGNVYLTMGGGCQGCAMSRATLTHGIKAAIIEAMPEVNDVIDATDHSAGSNPFYQ